jgi:hypothetical protein
VIPESSRTTSEAPPVAPGDRRTRTDVTDVDRAGEQRLDLGRAGVEHLGLDRRCGSQCLGKKAPLETDDRHGMREVGKIADSHGLDRAGRIHHQ